VDDLIKSMEVIATQDDLNDFTPDDAETKDHWSGKGHLEFFVEQNHGKTFEIQVVDYSGCVGGLQEAIGIEYALLEGYLDVDRSMLREGVTYTIWDITAEFSRGDGWTTDDDCEYHIGEITSEASLWGYLSHKVSIIWWRHIGCHIRNWKYRRELGG
jgi:hypothetical protein